METTESPAENEKAPVSEENQPAPDSNPNISETNPVDASDSKMEQESEKIDFDETLPTSDNPYRVSVTMTIAVAYPKRESFPNLNNYMVKYSFYKQINQSQLYLRSFQNEIRVNIFDSWFNKIQIVK